jgi:RNA polymerase sigma-70 factor (ECF subfamily)
VPSLAVRAARAVSPVTAIDRAPGDRELVTRAQAGDRWAAEALYRRHVAAATRIATLLLRRHADAEDVVQDAFVAALTQLDRLRDGAAFGGWLGRIVANGARSRLRRRRVFGWFGGDRAEDDATLDRLAAPGLSAEQRAELVLLDRALAAIPADERLAWTLRYIEGWRLAEIAGGLGVSLATAKRRLAAAERKLPACEAEEDER